MELTRASEASRARVSASLFGRRANQRGAAVFIVMFAVVLLSGLGIWAVQVSSFVDQASGFSRAGLQAQYAAELGIHTTTAALSLPGWGEANYRAARRAPDTCESTVGQPGTPFCRRLLLTDLDTVTQRQVTRNVIDQGTAGVPGGMSPYMTTNPAAIQGNFTVEMTEPQPAIVPGHDLSGSSYYRVTLTSRGEVRPFTADICQPGAADENAVAGRIGIRAHSLIGPIPQ